MTWFMVWGLGWKHLRGRFFISCAVAGLAFSFVLFFLLFDTMYPTKRSPSLE